MEDNLARELELDIEEQAVAVEQPILRPSQEPRPNVQPIPQTTPVSKGLSKFEIFLISAIGLIVFSLIIFNIHSSLELSNASRQVQDVNSAIVQAEIEIENLKQQSHELSQYDRINEIAQKHGLELHEENIINIAPQE